VPRVVKVQHVLLRMNYNFGSVFKSLSIIHEFILEVTVVIKEKCKEAFAQL
jgi:hypothetical protein